MEVVPIALLELWILIVVFAWSLGESVKAKSLVTLGVNGLVMAVLGVVLSIGLFSYFEAALHAMAFHTAAPSLPVLFTLVPFWVWLLAAVCIVVLGVLLTSAAYAFGLRQAVRGHVDWFIELLVGALLPLIWFSLTLVFAFASGSVPRPDFLNVYRFATVGLLGWVVSPLVAALVTTIAAKRLAARGPAFATPQRSQ
jgi:hypothetical protein